MMKKLISILLALLMVFSAAASMAAGGQNDRCEVFLKVYFDSNILLSTYNVRVYIDNTDLGMLYHGTDGTFFTRVAPGEHELKFVNTGDSAVKGTYRITVGTDSQVACTIKAHGSWIATTNVVVTPYPRTGSAQAEPAGGKYRLEYSIDFDENAMFSRYDVIMEMDGVQVATLYHGADRSGYMDLTPGIHHLKFSESGRPSNYKYYCFVLESDAVFSCGMHAYAGSIDLRNLQLKASGNPAPANSGSSSADKAGKTGSGNGNTTVADVEVKILDAAVKKALLLELDGAAELLKGLKGRPVAAALVSLLKAANDIEFDSGDEDNPDSGETASGNAAAAQKGIPDGAYERAARYGALITDGETRQIYRAMLEKEGYDPAKVFPDSAADSDPADGDVAVAGAEEKILDAGVKKALTAELDGAAKLLKGLKGRPVAAALVSLQKAANDIESGDSDGKKEIPDGAYKRAARYGEGITDVDTQLTYCALLKKEGYDLARVYPDGVEVDIDLRQYQPYTEEGYFDAAGSDGQESGEGNPDLSKVLIFSREDKDVPQMSWLQTPDPGQQDLEIRRLLNARTGADYGYKIRLRVDLMDHEKLSGKTARKLSECTAYVIIDKGYKAGGRLGYIERKNDSDVMYYTGFEYSAMEAVAVYQVSDPRNHKLWGGYTHVPLASTSVTSVLDGTNQLTFVFTYTDGSGMERTEPFLAKQHTMWNIPKYMVGSFEENWTDEFLKADTENGVPLLVLLILY